MTDLEKLKRIAKEAHQKVSSIAPGMVKAHQKVGHTLNPIIDNSMNEIMNNMQEIQIRKARQKNQHENPVLAIRPAIEQQIKAFEATLEQLDDPSLYVGLWLASFGQQRLIFANSIEFDEPCLVIFHGFSDDGSPLKLIQHISQLNFLLEARKRVTDEPRRPIGFIHNDDT